MRGTAGSACGGRDREWHQMLLLEFGLFQIPHLSVCLDSEQSVANASTENQRIVPMTGYVRLFGRVWIPN